ncbi:MAG: ribonuclease J [Chloroflexi bacterium]|nr:ribonuclease J [Chloroflexota bacterium]
METKLRIIPLGGLGEIGKNMTVIEYGDEIIIIDAGIMFPANDMYGIDSIIPDYKYLMDKLDHVKAVLVTHGHEDHVGALPYLMNDINAPIYATPLTAGLIDVKMRQARLDNQVEIIRFEAGDRFQVGQFMIEPFHVAHSIPDCVGFGITTPVGLIVHTGDYKFDHTPADGWPPDFAKIAEFSQRGVLCLLADSTNADRPGWTPSEQKIAPAFDEVFRNAPGRIIVASFASLISRIQQVADTAKKYGRKLAITGRSMRDNTKMARRLGYLEIDDDMLIDIDQAVKLPGNQVVIMATGSQGEPTAVMGRLARGRHNRLQVQEHDTIVFSAHAIPGNEEVVYRTINQLFRRGANVIYETIANVHVSGHASQEEMKLLINLIRPTYLVPIHGELRHLKQHAEIAKNLGIPSENIAVIENGTPFELTPHSMEVLPRMKGGYVFVDGASVGDIGWSIVRERDQLSQNGFFLTAVTTNGRGDIIGKPKIVSRGFVNLKEAEDLIEGAEETITRVVKLHAENRKSLTKPLEDALRRYFYAETGRRPMVQVIVS